MKCTAALVLNIEMFEFQHLEILSNWGVGVYFWPGVFDGFKRSNRQRMDLNGMKGRKIACGGSSVNTGCSHIIVRS